jgi:plastocyanin
MFASTKWPFRRIAGALAILAVGGCHGSSMSTTNPSNPNVVTITSAGVSPKTITIAVGSRVLFINNDSRSHSMNSNPHPDHTDCPEINQVGFLNPGQSRETGNLVVVRSCGYHDHDDPLTTSLQGTIIIK